MGFKIKELLTQIIKFGFTGVICFIIDYCVLLLLTEIFGVNYLISSAISFAVSVIVNYILSVKFVFSVDKEASKGRNFILFIVFSVMGLGLNQLLMWLGVDIMLLDYKLVKIGATAVVMCFNFITRKLFLEKK